MRRWGERGERRLAATAPQQKYQRPVDFGRCRHEITLLYEWLWYDWFDRRKVVDGGSSKDESWYWLQNWTVLEVGIWGERRCGGEAGGAGRRGIL